MLLFQVEPITLRIPLPKSGFSAPNLPELNHSQLHAVRSVLQQPLSLIQVSSGRLLERDGLQTCVAQRCNHAQTGVVAAANLQGACMVQVRCCQQAAPQGFTSGVRLLLPACSLS